MDEFVHLRVHSEYSLLEGACRIEELVNRAKELGMSSLAITDYGTMYGTIPFYKACKSKGIEPIIGMVMDVTYGDLEDRSVKNQKRFQLILLAENETGYIHLMKLATEAQFHTASGKPRVNHGLLKKYHEGLIAICTAQEGEVQHHLLERNFAAAYEVSRAYQKIYGEESFFLELNDQGLEDQRILNQRTIQCSRETGVPLVVTNNVHYVHPKDAAIQDILLCIGSGKLMADAERPRFPNQQFYLKSPEEMHRLFPYVKDALHNTVRIAERCRLELTFGKHILPRYPVPPNETASSYLRKLCEEGLVRRYSEPSEKITRRMDYELTVIQEMGFCDYFLIVWDFMKYAHERQIVTGPGRGSAAGSLVAYVLSITNVDPLQYKLLFERFLNPERISMPDIDIDFEVDRRGEVIDYVSRKYGKDHVAQIVTFGTMAARAAIRDVGRVMNFPSHLVDRTAKLIPSGMTIDEALENIAELKEAHEESEQLEQLLKMASGIEGLPRHVSTHAAGVVISRDPLTQFVPLQQGNEGHSLTQYSMEYLEAIGLLKMDFLGLRNLTIIESALRMIGQSRELFLVLDQIPHDDDKTFRLLSKGDTTGIFQLESNGMRNVLQEVKPSSLEDIIAILALYRPGPMEIIPDFAAAKNGRKPVHYLHEDLKPILEDTYGFILYQEQIMQIASKMAGYSLGQADILRRAVSKKKREMLEEQRESFVSGCMHQGYSKQIAQELYDLIVRFADYGFNRSHSAAYSLIAYQMAYLKANFPQEFMTALLSMAIGNPAKIAEYVDEAKRKGIPVLPPNINESQSLFTIANGKILFGLSAIKNVGTHAIRAILEERMAHGPFKSLLDLCRRVDSRICNRRVLEALVQSGSLDQLPGHRAQKLSLLDVVIEKGLSWRKEFSDGQGSLFAEESRSNLDEPVFPDIPPFTKKEILDLERELLGLYVSGHPLDDWDHILTRKEITPIHLLEERAAKEKVIVAGMLVDVKVINTRKGVPMAFGVLEDKVKQVELVIFPNVFEQASSYLKKEKLVVVEGRVELQDHQPKVMASRIWDMAALPDKPVQKSSGGLFIKVSEELEKSDKLLELQKQLLKNKGNIPVYLHYESKRETKKLQEKYNVAVDQELISKLEQVAGSGAVIYKT